MRRMPVLLALLILPFALHAQEQEFHSTKFSGGQLAALCRGATASEPNDGHLVCIGYIQGVLDSDAVGAGKVRRPYCIPAAVPSLTLAQVYDGYALANPEVALLRAPIAVGLAMAATYPCPSAPNFDFLKERDRER